MSADYGTGRYKGYDHLDKEPPWIHITLRNAGEDPVGGFSRQELAEIIELAEQAWPGLSRDLADAAVTRRLAEDGQHPFDPDWCLAPGVLLAEWMDDAHLAAVVLAVSCAAACTHPVPHPPPLTTRACRELRKQTAAAAITEVLDRKPLTADHAKMLAHGTLIPARFWLALEDSYRARLAAGKTDVSWDHRTETAQVPFTALTPDDVARLRLITERGPGS